MRGPPSPARSPLPLDPRDGLVPTVARVRRPSRSRRIVLTLTIGLVLGLTLAAVDAGRRADTSVERFIDFARPVDAVVFSFAFEPPVSALVEQTAQLADVTGADETLRIAIAVSRVRAEGRPRGDSGPMVQEVPLDTGWGSRFHRYRLLEGRAPRADAPHEIAINRRLAQLLDVGVGDRIVLELYPPDQIDVVANGGLPPAGSAQSVTLTVTGIQLRPGDLEAQPAAQAGTIEEFNQTHIAFSSAFWASLEEHEVALYGIGTGVNLTGAPGARARFASAARELGLTVEDDAPVDDRDALERSTRIEAIALYVLAGILAVAGAVLLGSALRRDVGLDPVDRSTLRAFGVRRAEMAQADVVRAAPILVGGMAVALLVALVGSPLLAFGVSGRAEPDPAVHFSVVVVLLAVVAVLLVAVVAIFAAALLGSSRDSRDDRAIPVRRGGRLVDRLAAAGAPPWTVTGVRMALPAPGRPGRATRSALVAITASVALLVGVVTFGASMRRLVTTPELRGWTWDVEVGNFSDPESTQAARRLLAANPDVELAAGYSDEVLDLDGRQVSLVGLERPAAVGVPVFEGRLPARRGEVALTGATLDEIGKDIGDDVRVSLADAAPQTLRIVGRSLGPGAVRPGGDLRKGGIMVLRDWQTATDSVGAAQTFVVRFGHGVDEDAAARNLRRSFPQAFFEPTVTADVDSFRKTQPLLAVLGVLLAIMAVATLLHAVDSARSRRRRELGVLKALGFGHGQVGASVIVQAVCLATCGIAVGLPLGLVAGRWAWIASAQAIGVVTTPVVSVLLPVVVLAALGASVLTSLGPARQARRLRTVDALRTE